MAACGTTGLWACAAAWDDLAAASLKLDGGRRRHSRTVSADIVGVAGELGSAQLNDGLGLSGGEDGTPGVAECGTTVQASAAEWSGSAAVETDALMAASCPARSARHVADLDLGVVIARCADVAQDVDRRAP